ncbi:MAG TPA: methyltransferase domain-containing protein [Verrucomicrobiae bacterium]|nr:methyltransferase domain-containing protein [Verrucomicrobiae bacterium]
MMRVVEPELLDSLPPEHPDASGSRKDLRRLNAWMGNVRILTTALLRLFPMEPPADLVEIGSGDGSFLAEVARRLPREWRGTRAILLDRSANVSAAACGSLEQSGWNAVAIQKDVFEWLEESPEPRCGAILCNLFLHHFSDDQLIRLLEKTATRANRFVAVEPRRGRAGLWSSRLVGCIGCNRITRHDAPASVRAGFQNLELSELWPDAAGWQIEERPAGWCSHLFVARRISRNGSGE